MSILEKLAILAKERKEVAATPEKPFQRKKTQNYVARKDHGDDLREWRKDAGDNGKQ